MQWLYPLRRRPTPRVFWSGWGTVSMGFLGTTFAGYMMDGSDVARAVTIHGGWHSAPPSLPCRSTAPESPSFQAATAGIGTDGELWCAKCRLDLVRAPRPRCRRYSVFSAPLRASIYGEQTADTGVAASAAMDGSRDTA